MNPCRDLLITPKLTDRSREPFPSAYNRTSSGSLYWATSIDSPDVTRALLSHAQGLFNGTHRRYQETLCRATSSKTCEHNVGMDYFIIGINLCAVVILSCCLFSPIGRYLRRLRRLYTLCIIRLSQTVPLKPVAVHPQILIMILSLQIAKIKILAKNRKFPVLTENIAVVAYIILL